MKKKIIIACVLIVFILTAVITYLIFTKPKENSVIKEKLKDYIAELGATFSTKQIYADDQSNGDLSKFKVLDPNKNEVKILNDEFLVKKLGKYSFSYLLTKDGKTTEKEAIINVSDTMGPSISFREGSPFAIIGSEYSLPKVVVNDFSSEQIKSSIKILNNNVEKQAKNGKIKIENFEPYKLSVEATDKFGNKSMKEFQILVKQEGEIESFDYAVNFSTIKQYDGIGTIDYNTDTRFVKNGTGSLKLYGKGYADTSYPGFYIPAPAITDLSGYEVFSFWVYNDSNRTVNLWFNNVVNDIVLYPKIWNKIEIPKTEFGKYFVDYKNLTVNAAPDKERKGILLFFINGAEDTTLYVDSMYAYKKDRSPKITADLKNGTIHMPYTISAGTVTDDKDTNLTATIKVFDPNSQVIELGKDRNFTPKLKGSYTVIYSVVDSDGFEGYTAKQFIVREPTKENEVEAFDDASCIFSLNSSGAIATFNKDRKFTKNKSEGSLKISVAKGTQATWPYVMINPKVSDISTKNTISFWLYNNKQEDAYVILNKNVIIKVPGNSWKLTELQKGTSDYNAAFSDLAHISLKLDVWNYDYDKFNGEKTSLYEREIYIDSIYAYEKSPLPKITVDVKNGTVRVPYLVPEAIVTDDKDSNITATFKVYTPNNLLLSVGVDKRFTPTMNGKYRIIYSAIDNDSNEGYLEKEVIIRDAPMLNEVEAFDEPYCLSGMNTVMLSTTYNTDKKFTKNNSEGSLKISVPKGTVATWPYATIVPKVTDISNKNVLSFWVYNNKPEPVAVILNKNIIIKVAANSWKRVELKKGTSDFIAAFPDSSNISFLFDVWNYDYDKYDGDKTLIYDREIYIDSIYAYENDPAPQISVLPQNGTINVPYTVPNGLVTDDKDVGLTASYQVFAPDNQRINVTPDHKFTPTLKGKHKIVYSAIDSEGNEGYVEKEFIVREAIKQNEIEGFDDEYCMDGISRNGALVSYNTDKNFTKNNSNGSIKISVGKGTEATWPYALVNPKVSNIEGADILSFWLYNNTADDTYVIVNSNLIILVPANSWKYTELIKGTSDYNAVFPDPTHITLKFDVWNYNYDKYYGKGTQLFAREIYVDEIYVSNFVPRNANEIESFDDSSRIANAYRQGMIYTAFNADTAFTKNNSKGSLKVTVPKGGAQTWQSITLVDPGKTTPKLFNTLAPSKVSFWVYNNKPDSACIIFNGYASPITIPGNSWKYVEYWWDGSANSAEYWGVFPNPWEAKFKFDVLNFNFGTSDPKLYDRELYFDEIYITPY